MILPRCFGEAQGHLADGFQGAAPGVLKPCPCSGPRLHPRAPRHLAPEQFCCWNISSGAFPSAHGSSDPNHLLERCLSCSFTLLSRDQSIPWLTSFPFGRLRSNASILETTLASHFIIRRAMGGTSLGCPVGKNVHSLCDAGVVGSIPGRGTRFHMHTETKIPCNQNK